MSLYDYSWNNSLTKSFQAQNLCCNTLSVKRWEIITSLVSFVQNLPQHCLCRRHESGRWSPEAGQLWDKWGYDRRVTFPHPLWKWLDRLQSVPPTMSLYVGRPDQCETKILRHLAKLKIRFKTITVIIIANGIIWGWRQLTFRCLLLLHAIWNDRGSTIEYRHL